MSDSIGQAPASTSRAPSPRCPCSRAVSRTALPDVSRQQRDNHEAVQLVLQSLIEGEHGEILVLDMGKPIKILDVAKRMIDNSGKPIEIVFTGLSPGEKLHEVLIAQDETFARSIDTPILHILKSEGRDALGE